MSEANFHDYFASANAQEGLTRRAKTFIGCRNSAIWKWC